jgi:hypothetical protein
VHVFGHDDVSIDAELIFLTNPLQGGEERLASRSVPEIQFPVMAAESQEVNVTRILESFQCPRQSGIVFSESG